MKLDVIIRTHDGKDIHADWGSHRYCGVEKSVLIDKCVASLIHSLLRFEESMGWEVAVHWIDDGSSPDTKAAIRERFQNSVHLYEHTMTGSGFNASAFLQFKTAIESTADLVYLVEDDYLHYPTAIEEMVDAYLTFSKNLGVPVGIHPFDDPDNYIPRGIHPCRVVYGKNRHWRTNIYTTFTMMLPPDLIRANWSLFYTLATEFRTEWGDANNIHEGTTINSLWRDQVTLFTPIPSLALHMQFEAQRDPYLSWKDLWNSYDGKKLE